MGKKQFCFFQTAETGNRAPDSGVKGSGANHYPRAPARVYTYILCSHNCIYVHSYVIIHAIEKCIHRTSISVSPGLLSSNLHEELYHNCLPRFRLATLDLLATFKLWTLVTVYLPAGGRNPAWYMTLRDQTIYQIAHRPVKHWYCELSTVVWLTV